MSDFRSRAAALRIRRKSITGAIERHRYISYLRSKRRSSRSRANLDTRRTFFDAFFKLTASSPEDTISLLRTMTIPVMRQENISLPYNVNASFAPGDCISLSEMGYTVGPGGCCSLCSYGWSNAPPLDLPALELAFLHHLSSVVEFKELVASLRVFSGESVVGSGAYENEFLLDTIKNLLAQATLFYAYYTVKGGLSQDFTVLLVNDPRSKKFPSGYLMYFVFKQSTPLHLGAKLLKQLIFNCPGYTWHVDVFAGTFLLIVSKEDGPGYSEHQRVKLNPESVYRRYCDILVTDEKIHEYTKLYSTFATYSPPITS
ncbi:nuclear egress lamina protein [Gallid alphaherpesvirus 1]|nr:nuclear egress lamina protein [Gallid alphaherpesvirus 1]ATD84335.1 nuclear egress lamina protein [Gallid alphaherpesvirus 1]WEG21239.1 nuclear egress lamina protein [Gallid alphaherpesvirus 1]